MDKNTIARLRKFPEYRDVEFVERSELPIEMIDTSSDMELQHLIFAPDPITGVPRSDLGIVMSRDAAPEVAQYIRDNLMQVQQDVVNAGDDPDLALAGIKQRNESIDNYMQRLRDYANVNQ